MESVAEPEVEQAPPQQPQAPPQTKAEKLYDGLLKAGYSADVLGTKDKFIEDVQDPIKANKLYSGLRMSGFSQETLGTMVDFRNNLIVPKKAGGAGSPLTSQPSRIGSNNFQPSPDLTNPSLTPDIQDKSKQPYTPVTDPALKQQIQKGDQNAFTDKDRATLDDMHQKVQAQNDAATEQQMRSGQMPGMRLIEQKKQNLDYLRKQGLVPKKAEPHSWDNLGYFTSNTVMSGLHKDVGQLFDFLGSNYRYTSADASPLADFGKKMEGVGKEEEEQAQQTALPETTAGRVTSGAIGFVPDLIELAATPELDLGKVGELIGKYGGKYALKGAEIATGKFPTLLATKGLISGYDDAKAEGKDDWQSWKQGFTDAAKGFGEGTLYEGAGAVAGKVSKVGSKLLGDAGLMAGNKIVAGAEKALLNSTAQTATFSIVPFISNAVQGKSTSLDELKDNAIFGGVLGLFHIPGEDKAEVTPADVASKEIIDRSPAIDLHNFLTADTDAIVTAHQMDATAADFQAKGAAHAQQAFTEEDPEIKQQQVVQSSTSGKIASVKAVANTILANKNALIDGINELPIPDEIKQQIIAKVEEVNKRINPAEQEKQAIAGQIQQIDEAINNNQQRMGSTDPIEKADAEVVDERLNKEKENLETNLKKTISNEYERQGKADEELRKEREQAQQAVKDVVPEEQKAPDTQKTDDKPETPVADEPKAEVPKVPEAQDTGAGKPEKSYSEILKDQKAIKDKAKELANQYNATNTKLKDQKADIVDQMQEVHDAFGGDVDNEDAVKKAGYEIENGKVIFHVQDDGVFKINKDWLVTKDAIDQVKKEFPTDIGKQTPSELNKDNKKQKPGRPSTGTGTDHELLLQNIAEAKRIGNKKLQAVFERELGYSPGDQEAPKSEGSEDKKPSEPAETAKTGGDQKKAKPSPKETYELPTVQDSYFRNVVHKNNPGVDLNDVKAEAMRLAKAGGRKIPTFGDFAEAAENIGDNKPSRLTDQKASSYVAELVGKFIEHDVVPLAKKLAGGVKELSDWVVNTAVPTNNVPTKAMDIVMTKLGGENEAKAELDKIVGGAEKMFDKMKDPDRIAFIDRIKRGLKQPTQALQDIADLYAKLDKRLYDQLKKVFPNLNELVDHYRVLWKVLPGSKDGGDRRWWGLRTRRPLEGSKGFLKQHTLLDMSEGIERGGEPVSTNPMTMFKIAYADAMKSITAKNMLDGLKDGGFVKFVKESDIRSGNIPDGYTQLNDKIAKKYFPVETGDGKTLMQKSGEYFIEENTGRIINNHLSRDYIREAKLGEGIMELKNLYTGVELSLSGFHASAIALEGMSSDIGLGYRKLVNLGLRGDWKEALDGAKKIIFSPFSPKTTYSLGRSFIKLSNQADFENSDFGKKLLKRMPNAKEYLHDFFIGGGLTKQHEELKAHTYQTLKDNWAKENYIGAAFRSIPAFNQLIMSPLFDTYIPAMKVGVFMKEYPTLLKENAGRLAKGQVTREQLARKTVNFIDNRMGETNFDNIFWNRTFKSINQLNFRSVTWKLGNVKAMGGAVPEQLMEFKNAVREKRAPLLEPKMAWVLGLATTQGVLATVTQKFMAGSYPSSFKDFIAPRTDKDDDKQRMMLPTYFRDIATLKYNTGIHWYSSAQKYTSSSLSGPTGALIDIWQNKDFENYQIYDHKDDVLTQLGDIGKHLEPEPISVQNFLKQNKKGEPWIKRGFSLIGLNEAPKYLVNPPIDNKIFDLYDIQEGVRTKGEKETAELKRQIRDLYTQHKDDDATKLINEGVESGKLDPKEVKYLGANDPAFDPAVAIFGKLKSMDDKIWLYNQMTDEEKDEYDPKGEVAKAKEIREKYEKEQEAKNKKDKPYSSFK